MAPDEILKVQKKHGKYNYILIYNDFSGLVGTVRKFLQENKKIIIHFHNKFINHNIFENQNIRKIIHYHSEPSNPSITLFPENNRFVDAKLVLNQYHCTLNSYNDCEPVRNFFNWNPEPIFNENKITIGYSPSVTRSVNRFWDKGYSETVLILNKIKEKYDVEIKIITNRPYNECINIKKECHIIIDECKTGSFHKCTIEGLMLGAVVFVNINEKINQRHIKEYGKTLPVVNCDLINLQNKLEEYINLGKERLEEIAIENRNKFKSYWSAQIVCQEFDNIYDRIYMNHNIVKGVNHSKKNWGDSINSYIFKELSGNNCRFFSQVQAINSPHYIICGSIMRLSNKHSIIWGTGFISQNDSIGLGKWENKNNIVGSKPLQVCAVRGKLTRDKLIHMDIQCPEVYGDPALLFKFFYNPQSNKKYKYGIIPHYIDKDTDFIKKIISSKQPNIKVIDICVNKNGTIFDIIDQVCECEIIFSSTLHGVILGDIYCHKSYYIKLSDKVEGGDFKFRDYFTSVNRNFICLHEDEVNTMLKNQVPEKYNYNFKFDYDSLINSCPFISNNVKEKMIEFYKNL